MRRPLAVTISAAVTAVLLISGCSQTQSTTTAKTGASGDGPVRVAFVSQVEGIPYFNGFDKGALRAAKDLGITYNQTGPATIDATEQVRILNNLVSQGYDAVAISPLDPTSINNSISNAIKRGVKIATADADAPDSARAVFVSQASDTDLGTTVMEQLAKATGGSGQYGIISGSADSATFNAWIKAAQTKAATSYPGMKLVGGIRYTKDTAGALAEAQNLMTAYPNLKGIIAVPSTAVPGVGQAVTNAGKIGKVSVTGFGSPQTAGPFLKSGAMTSSVLWNVDDLGYLTVWALDQLVKGTKFKTSNTVAGLKQPISYNPSTKILLLGKPTIFTKDNYANFNF